ncbi:MAG: Holliday junction ATP-dependent DNA helicase RuvA [Chlamydiae bacterium]|nr:Holliday junction ATP-dependent DNA helicase RuvA [Chlamydiota bacterium]
MYAFLKGHVVENNLSYIILDVQGVGYKAFVPLNVINNLPNETCTLYTSLVIRETSHSLYGFPDSDSRDLFETLIGISGIGPKTALCLLSKFTPQSLKQAVLEQNINLIATVPGIGKKTAERLVFDIRDKLNKMPITSSEISSSSSHQNFQDALQALMNLGFSQASAQNAVEKVVNAQPETLELSEIITQALRHS